MIESVYDALKNEIAHDSYEVIMKGNDDKQNQTESRWKSPNFTFHYATSIAVTSNMRNCVGSLDKSDHTTASFQF